MEDEPLDTPVDTQAEPAPNEPAPAPSDEVTADSFGWDDWDGSFDAVPEPHRGWVQHAHNRAMATAEAAERDAREARRIFESLTEGREDPRVAELTQKMAEGEELSKRELAELQAKFDEAAERLAERDALIKAYQDRESEKVNAEVEAFSAKHPWIFDGGKVEALAEELYDEGFHMNDFPELLRMPKQLLDAARDEMKALKGVPDAGAKAIRLARAGTEIKFTTNDDLVSGTRTPASTHNQKLPENLNVLEAAEIFAERALRRHRR